MTVRILLGMIGAEWQRLLTEAVQADRELEIVGVAENAMDILLQAEGHRVDVVVLAQLPGGEEPGICSHLLLEFPNVPVLLLPCEPRRGALCRMVLRKESWQEASQEILLAALKA
jgi:chemotaxis response regulator CheB